MRSNTNKQKHTPKCIKANPSASSVSVIGGADGPASIFIAGNARPSISKKLHRYIYEQRKKQLIRSLQKQTTPISHTLDEVILYAKSKYGYRELSEKAPYYPKEYRQMRISFLQMYQPSLLGKYAVTPSLKSQNPEDLNVFFHQQKLRDKAAADVPVSLFDIDLHLLIREYKDGSIETISIEKNFSSISDSVSGRKRRIKSYQKTFRDIWKYYGVRPYDIRYQTKRFQEYVAELLTT